MEHHFCGSDRRGRTTFMELLKTIAVAVVIKTTKGVWRDLILVKEMS